MHRNQSSEVEEAVAWQIQPLRIQYLSLKLGRRVVQGLPTSGLCTRSGCQTDLSSFVYSLCVTFSDQRRR